MIGRNDESGSERGLLAMLGLLAALFALVIAWHLLKHLGSDESAVEGPTFPEEATLTDDDGNTYTSCGIGCGVPKFEGKKRVRCKNLSICTRKGCECHLVSQSTDPDDTTWRVEAGPGEWVDYDQNRVYLCQCLKKA